MLFPVNALIFCYIFYNAMRYYVIVQNQIILTKTWKCIQRSNAIIPSKIVFELYYTIYIFFCIKWLNNNIRDPVAWKMFDGVAQGMPHYLANGRSIFSLESKQKETLSSKALNTAPVHSSHKALIIYWLHKSILQIILY